MSFLGALGRGLAGAGALFAAPFTGGTSLAALGPILGGIGGVMSGAAGGSARQRGTDNDELMRQQQLLQQQARDSFSAGLQGANFNRESQDRERRKAMLMALLQGTQDQTIAPGNPAIAGRMPTVTGGARPSNLTGNAAALMALLGQPELNAPEYQAPPSMNLQRPGAGERILGGVGLGGSILGALGGLLGGGGSGLGNVNGITDRLGRGR